MDYKRKSTDDLMRWHIPHITHVTNKSGTRLVPFKNPLNPFIVQEAAGKCASTVPTEWPNLINHFNVTLKVATLSYRPHEMMVSLDYLMNQDEIERGCQK